MGFIKHVGRIKTTNKKIIIAYRTLPNDPYNCLVIPTESLDDQYHNALINLVESPSGQECDEFAEVLARSSFSDGRIMLAALHTQGKLVKVSTENVDVVPNMSTSINLAELNNLIAQQKGISINDLAVKDPQNTNKENHNKEINTNNVVVLNDESLAEKYRNDAAALTEEAKRLRKLANELHPTKKKTAKVVSKEPAESVETNIQRGKAVHSSVSVSNKDGN